MVCCEKFSILIRIVVPTFFGQFTQVFTKKLAYFEPFFHKFMEIIMFLRIQFCKLRLLMSCPFDFLVWWWKDAMKKGVLSIRGWQVKVLDSQDQHVIVTSSIRHWNSFKNSITFAFSPMWMSLNFVYDVMCGYIYLLISSFQFIPNFFDVFNALTHWTCWSPMFNMNSHYAWAFLFLHATSNARFVTPRSILVPSTIKNKFALISDASILQFQME